MADEAVPQDVVALVEGDTSLARADVAQSEVQEPAVVNGGNTAQSEPSKDVAIESIAPASPTSEKKEFDDSKPTSDTQTYNKPATTQEDVEMKDNIKPTDAAPAADESVASPVGDSTATDKSKAPRKSGGIPEHKKKLNKKASKAKMTHTDAQPGDYFFVRLKGYPLWPAIVCDESMLPSTLIKSRPVTAARPDGTYRADYEDGGSKVKDRTFPVMYLHTNEFGWIPNFDLVDLDFDTVADVSQTLRKDLYAAHQLAAEKNDLDYFKEILKNFMEARAAEIAAKEAAKAAKKATKAKAKSKTVVETDEDSEMVDAPVGAESEEADGEVPLTEKPKKTKKRKAEEDASTPQRSESAKKAKTTLKFTNTPKTANGTATPQAAKDSATKPVKSKSKKVVPKVKEAEVIAPKEPELSSEEKRVKKEKEIMFLRHKLQKGLLIRDQDPKEEEMKQMSEFISKLEGYADLEVSIIRATKINKVLKAILKLSAIPKEDEFQFKSRSQTLLDKWNKLLASDQAPAVAPPTTATTNGVDEAIKAESEEAKLTKTTTETINGIKEPSVETKVEEKVPIVEEPVAEVKETPKVEAPAPTTEQKQDLVAEPTPVESTALVE